MKKKLAVIFYFSIASSWSVQALSLSWRKKNINKHDDDTKKILINELVQQKQSRDRTIYSSNTEALLAELEEALDRGQSIDAELPLVLHIIKSFEKQDVDIIFSYTRALKNKLKRLRRINATTVASIISAISEMWEVCFVARGIGFDKKPVGMENMLLDAFIGDFQAFKSNPDYFIKRLSDDIENKIVQTEENVTVKTISDQCVCIIEMLLGKLDWSCDNVDKIWLDFLEVANSIYAIGKKKVVPTLDEIIDFYTTLVATFNSFLDKNCLALPEYFYDLCLTSIANGETDFFTDLKDANRFGKSEREFLIESLTIARTKVNAYKHPELIKKLITKTQ